MYCVMLLKALQTDSDICSVFVYRAGDIISCHSEQIELQLVSVHNSHHQADQAAREIERQVTQTPISDGMLKVTPFSGLNIVLTVKTQNDDGVTVFATKLLCQRFSCQLDSGEELIVHLITPSRKEAKRLYRDPAIAIARAYKWQQLVMDLPLGAVVQAAGAIAEA